MPEAEMDRAQTIVLVGQNLYFLGQVENIAEPRGYETLRATTEEAFWRHYNRRPPSLVLVDLEGEQPVWTSVVPALRSENPDTPIIAFGPHEDTATMDQARTLGCSAAMSKGEFHRDLAKIVDELVSG